MLLFYARPIVIIEETLIKRFLRRICAAKQQISLQIRAHPPEANKETLI
jgi:hypothetical protein